jgi:hypothetical protein
VAAGEVEVGADDPGVVEGKGSVVPGIDQLVFVVELENLEDAGEVTLSC